MRQNLRLRLEIVRKNIIDEIITRSASNVIDTSAAFRFISNINQYSYSELLNLTVKAATDNISVYDLFIDELPF